MTNAQNSPESPIPVTILTGYLGAGKTTIITNVIKSMPKDYKIAWLKNEVGDLSVDSILAKEAGVATIKEMLQGCICHIMIGQLGFALTEILDTKPDRIIIETSGSATPAPIVLEIRKNKKLFVDGVITVIDAINFQGYVGKSYTLQMQAKYTDLILINKHEDLDEGDLEKRLDDLYEINLDTPKINTDHGKIDSHIIFGLDSKLFLSTQNVTESEMGISANHQKMEIDLINITSAKKFDSTELEKIFAQFPREHFYRIKGYVDCGDHFSVINIAFGNFQLIPTTQTFDASRIVFMGREIDTYKNHILTVFDVPESAYRFTPREQSHH